MISLCPILHLPNSLSLPAYNPIFHVLCPFQSLSDVACRASSLGWLVEMPLLLVGTAPLIGSFDLYNFRAKPHPFSFPSGKNSWLWIITSAPISFCSIYRGQDTMVDDFHSLRVCWASKHKVPSQGSYTKLALRAYYRTKRSRHAP